MVYDSYDLWTFLICCNGRFQDVGILLCNSHARLSCFIDFVSDIQHILWMHPVRRGFIVTDL